MIALQLQVGTFEPTRLMLKPGDVLVLSEKSHDGSNVLRIEINGRPYVQAPNALPVRLEARLLEGGG